MGEAEEGTAPRHPCELGMPEKRRAYVSSCRLTLYPTSMSGCGFEWTGMMGIPSPLLPDKDLCHGWEYCEGFVTQQSGIWRKVDTAQGDAPDLESLYRPWAKSCLPSSHICRAYMIDRSCGDTKRLMKKLGTRYPSSARHTCSLPRSVCQIIAS